MLYSQLIWPGMWVEISPIPEVYSPDLNYRGYPQEACLEQDARGKAPPHAGHTSAGGDPQYVSLCY